MIVHYSIAAELARQRQQELARSFAGCRPRHAPRRRWWEPGFLHHPSAAREAQAAGQVPAPA